MTVDADDLGRYYADITDRRRADVTAAAEQIARAEANEAGVVAEIEQQAHEAITVATDSTGDPTTEETSHSGWPAQERDQQEFPAAFLPIDDTEDGETRRRRAGLSRR